MSTSNIFLLGLRACFLSVFFLVISPLSHGQAGLEAADEIREVVDLADDQATFMKQLIKEINAETRTLKSKYPNDAAAVKSGIRALLKNIRERSYTENKPGGGEKGGNGHQGVRTWVKALQKTLLDKELIHFTDENAQDQLLCKAEGLGRTTGSIARIEVYNPSSEDITVSLGPYYIPSIHRQSYLVPGTLTITIPAGETRSLLLEGYCANIYAPPVPRGEAMTDFAHWINPEEAPDMPEPGLPFTETGWESYVPSDPEALLVTYPGTEIPLQHKLDIHRNPETAAAMLLHAVREITATYDRMKEDSMIQTPISDMPRREREAVIQQSFWIYTGNFTGDGYKMPMFVENGEKQLEQQSGTSPDQLPQEQQEAFYAGLGTFWGTYEAVLKEAKVMAEPPDALSEETR